MLPRAILLLTFRAFVLAAAASALSLSAADPEPNLIADGGNAEDFDMAPETRLEVVKAAVAELADPLPVGPFQPTWESLRKHYRVPAWFDDAKFGLFMHWGLYAVPAYHNEWYEKHMYAGFADWHREHFGPPAKFGYKDFIPLFKAEQFDANAWADLFKRSGARFVIPTAQHHDNFALWDSAVTPFNAKAMGPKRDLIGELAAAVRRQGLKFGVSNHGIENFQFINPAPDLRAELQEKQADLFDPKWTDFYHVADRSDEACRLFLVDWYRRNVELIEKYEPDMLWFDNGVDQRFLDPLKLQLAAYYYNRAAQRGQAVSLSTKKAAYAPTNRNSQTIGSIIDFEKIGKRSPAGIRSGAWQVDEPIGSTWGYTDGMRISPPGVIIAKLADTVSKGGTLLLNLSPKADGTIPAEQQETLLGIGRWLDRHGEAIYGSHAWTTFGYDQEGDGRRVRFTVRGDYLYAILLGPWTAGELLLPPVTGRTTSVTLLGTTGELAFTAGPDGLRVTLPAIAPDAEASVFKISGLTFPPTTATPDGNPR